MALLNENIIRPKLEHIDIEITRACNYNCVHCSAGALKQDTSIELTYDEIKKIINDSYELGLTKLGLTGGEPLLEEEKMFDLISYAYNSLKIPVHIHTNGSLVTDEIAKRLRRHDVLTTISIFTNNEVNDEITRTDGSLELTLNGIKNALNNDINLHIFIVPSKLNVPYIKDIIYQLNKIGAKIFRILSLSPTGRAIEQFNDMSLTKEQIQKLNADLLQLRDEYGIDIQSGFCTHQTLPELFYLKGHDQCYSGKNRLHIDAIGNVYPCTAASGRPVFSAGNLRKIPLDEIWNNSPLLQFIRRYHHERPLKCKECVRYDECMGGCRVSMAYHYGDFSCAKPDCGGPYSK